VTPGQELKLRGIKLTELMNELPHSYDSIVKKLAHEVTVANYWAQRKFAETDEYSPKVSVTEVGVVAEFKPEKKEYSFTDAQIKIAMSAQEKSTKLWH
jgi:hypothetical protein